jgi:hypothetical protein
MKHIKTYEGLFSKPDDDIVKELIKAVKENKYTNFETNTKTGPFYKINLTFEIGDSKIEIEYRNNIYSDHFYLEINSKPLETSQKLIKKLYNIFVKIDEEKDRVEIEKEKEKLKYNLTPEA